MEEVGFTAEAQRPLRGAKVRGLRVVEYGEEKKFFSPRISRMIRI